MADICDDRKRDYPDDIAGILRKHDEKMRAVEYQKKMTDQKAMGIFVLFLIGMAIITYLQIWILLRCIPEDAITNSDIRNDIFMKFIDLILPWNIFLVIIGIGVWEKISKLHDLICKYYNLYVDSYKQYHDK